MPASFFFDTWNTGSIMFRVEEIYWTIYFRGYPASNFTCYSNYPNTSGYLEELVSRGEGFTTISGFTQVPVFAGQRVRLIVWSNNASIDLSKVEMFYVLSTPYGLMPR